MQIRRLGVQGPPIVRSPSQALAAANWRRSWAAGKCEMNPRCSTGVSLYLCMHYHYIRGWASAATNLLRGRGGAPVEVAVADFFYLSTSVSRLAHGQPRLIEKGLTGRRQLFSKRQRPVPWLLKERRSEGKLPRGNDEPEPRRPRHTVLVIFCCHWSNVWRASSPTRNIHLQTGEASSGCQLLLRIDPTLILFSFFFLNNLLESAVFNHPRSVWESISQTECLGPGITTCSPPAGFGLLLDP